MQGLLPISPSGELPSPAYHQRPMTYFRSDSRDATCAVHCGGEDPLSHWHSHHERHPFKEVDLTCSIGSMDIATAKAMTMASTSPELFQRRQRRQRQQQLMLMRMMYSSASTPCYNLDGKKGVGFTSSFPRPPRADVEAVLLSTLTSVFSSQSHELSSPTDAMGDRHQMLQVSPVTAASMPMTTHRHGLVHGETKLPDGVRSTSGGFLTPPSSVFLPRDSAANESDCKETFRQFFIRQTGSDWQQMLRSSMVEAGSRTSSIIRESVTGSCGDRSCHTEQQQPISGSNNNNDHHVDRMVSSTSGKLKYS